MSGRRWASWFTDGKPEGGWASIHHWDYSDSFEDETIERLDRQARMKGIVSSLTPAEQRMFVRHLLGFKCESPAERMALSRARRRVTKLLENVL
jgi:hypothetical protein